MHQIICMYLKQSADLKQYLPKKPTNQFGKIKSINDNRKQFACFRLLKIKDKKTIEGGRTHFRKEILNGSTKKVAQSFQGSLRNIIPDFCIVFQLYIFQFPKCQPVS